MNSKVDSSGVFCGLGSRMTLTPDAPQTICDPAVTSLTGTVVTAPSLTMRPQSISGLLTRSHRPSTRTSVSRLVVE